jgi:hypothetical protein
MWKLTLVCGTLVLASVSAPTRKKGRLLHSMMLLLIGCMKILFLNLATNIFGLD